MDSNVFIGNASSLEFIEYFRAFGTRPVKRQTGSSEQEDRRSGQIGEDLCRERYGPLL